MTWWRRLWHRAQMEEDLEKELSFHLEQHVSDLIATGHEPEEARRLARLALGGPEQVKERCRDASGTRWLEDLLHDIQYALRSLRQRPGFTAVALGTLALGTGATTVMFTVINGVLFKPLPYRDSGRLVNLQEQTDWSTSQGNLWAFTYPNYLDCKRETAGALEMAAFRYSGGTVSLPGEAEYVDSFEVSSDLFSLLGVHLFRGREFLPEEDRPGGAPVAIVSYDFWQRRYGGSPSAIGSRLVFDGKPYTIIGIAPTGFRLDGAERDVLTPMGQGDPARLLNRGAHGLGVWARLRPGATLAQANTELAVVGRRLAAQYPKSNKGRTFIAEPLRPHVGDVRPTLWLLLGAVGFVLLIVCVNIASLLLARAVAREREFAIRMALGAGPWRLTRQSLTESGVLGLAGGALGLLLAAIGIRPFVALWPGTLPRAEEVNLDWRVLLFTVAVSLACGALFGLAPALRAAARELERSLQTGARSLAGSSRRVHSVFVISEIALAVVLLSCAGILGRTLLRLSSLDPGVNVHNVLTARVSLPPATLADPGRARAAWQDILDRGREVPGIEAIAMIDTVPMRQGSNPVGYSLSAAELPPDKQPLVLANCTTPGYLKVMGIPLRRGRFITDQDRMGTQSVAVIDDVMAQQAFPGQDPLGKHLWIGITSDPVTVVGVVAHVRQWGLAGDDQNRLRAQLYYPFAQVRDAYVRRWSELMSIAARTGVDPLSAIAPLGHEIRGAANNQVLYQVHTMEQLSSDSLARQRFLLLLFGIFAALALFLACIGIYGVLAYLTGRRAPEIGVRMALGANAREVMWIVLRQSLGMIFAGISLGLFAAVAAGHLLQRLVEGMRPPAVSTFIAMTAILSIAALLASLVPALRASRVDPASALRQD